MDRPCSICTFPDPFHHLAHIQRKAVSLSDLLPDCPPRQCEACTPEKGSVSEGTRRKAIRNYEMARTGKQSNPSPKRARATSRALKRETRTAASKEALSKQATSAAHRRSSAAARSEAWRKAAWTRAKKRLSGIDFRNERRRRLSRPDQRPWVKVPGREDSKGR
jgi:hypothetical protein